MRFVVSRGVLLGTLWFAVFLALTTLSPALWVFVVAALGLAALAGVAVGTTVPPAAIAGRYARPLPRIWLAGFASVALAIGVYVVNEALLLRLARYLLGRSSALGVTVPVLLEAVVGAVTVMFLLTAASSVFTPLFLPLTVHGLLVGSRLHGRAPWPASTRQRRLVAVAGFPVLLAFAGVPLRLADPILGPFAIAQAAAGAVTLALCVVASERCYALQSE